MVKTSGKGHIVASGGSLLQHHHGGTWPGAGPGHKYLGQSQLSFYGRFILESPDRPGSSQHYQESTFTIPDTPQNTDLYGQKLEERENKSLEMKETFKALTSCMIVEISFSFFSKSSTFRSLSAGGEGKISEKDTISKMYEKRRGVG